jgi:hypothetical protein
MQPQNNQSTRSDIQNIKLDYPTFDTKSFSVYETIESSDSLNILTFPSFRFENILFLLNKKSKKQIKVDETKVTVLNQERSFSGNKVRFQLKELQLDLVVKNDINIFPFEKFTLWIEDDFNKESGEWVSKTNPLATDCWIFSNNIEKSIDGVGKTLTAEFSLVNLENTYTPENYFCKIFLLDDQLEIIKKVKVTLAPQAFIGESYGIATYKFDKTNQVFNNFEHQELDNLMRIKLHPISTGYNTIFSWENISYPWVQGIPYALNSSKYKASVSAINGLGDEDDIYDKNIFFNAKDGEVYKDQAGADASTPESAISIPPQISTHSAKKPRANDQRSPNFDPSKAGAAYSLNFSETESYFLRTIFPKPYPDKIEEDDTAKIVYDKRVFDINLINLFANGKAFISPGKVEPSINKMGSGSLVTRNSKVISQVVPAELEPVVKIYDVRRQTSGGYDYGIGGQVGQQQAVINNQFTNQFINWIPFAGKTITSQRDLDSKVKGRLEGQRQSDLLKIGTDSIIDDYRARNTPHNISFGVYGKWKFLRKNMEVDGELRQIDRKIKGVDQQSNQLGKIDFQSTHGAKFIDGSQTNKQVFNFLTPIKSNEISFFTLSAPSGKFEFIKQTVKKNDILNPSCLNKNYPYGPSFTDKSEFKLANPLEFEIPIDSPFPLEFLIGEVVLTPPPGYDLPKVELKITIISLAQYEISTTVGQIYSCPVGAPGASTINNTRFGNVEFLLSKVISGQVESQLALQNRLLGNGFDYKTFSDYLKQAKLCEKRIDPDSKLIEYIPIDNTSKFIDQEITVSFENSTKINILNLITILQKQPWKIELFNESDASILIIENLQNTNQVNDVFTSTGVQFIK